MARSTSKSSSKPQDVEAIAAAVLAILQGQQEKSSGRQNRKTNAKTSEPKTVAKTIKNPDARATVRQVFKVAALCFEAHYGRPMPNPLTMGDVQAIIDDLG